MMFVLWECCLIQIQLTFMPKLLVIIMKHNKKKFKINDLLLHYDFYFNYFSS